MPKTAKFIQIFLASPGDVKTERNNVKKVANELSRTVGKDKNVRLEVICSENAYPGYGKDGQRIINKQIGKMDEYDLFILIMKNRFGSPTKRCASGTSEEFQRARKAHEETGKPEIWFYSGSMKQNVKKQEDKKQQTKVKAFKTRFINSKCGLFKEYKSPADFKNQLREQLTLWLLNDYSKRKTRKSSTNSKTKTASSKKKEPAKKPQLLNQSNKVNSSSNKTTKKQLSTNNKNNKYTKKSTTKAKTNSSKITSITSSRAWVLLGDYLFESQSVFRDKNQSIILNILVKNPQQAANLGSLQPNTHYYNGTIIPYSFQNDASMAQIENMTSKFVKGKTSYEITLKPVSQSYGYNTIMSCNGYSQEQIAELRIRFLLLNANPKNQNINNQSTLNYLLQGSSYSSQSREYIFKDIWKKWKNNPKMFLYNARLAAVYQLKNQNLVENILKFKISLSKNVVSIDFCGQISADIYSTSKLKEVVVKGKCTL